MPQPTPPLSDLEALLLNALEPLLQVVVDMRSQLDNQEQVLKDLKNLAIEQLEMNTASSLSGTPNASPAELIAQVEAQRQDLQAIAAALSHLAAALENHKLPNYTPLFGEFRAALISLERNYQTLPTLISETNSSGKISKIAQTTQDLSSSLGWVEQSLRSQSQLLSTHLNWKIMAVQMVGSSLIAAALLLTGLHLFPPNPYPLLDQKLQILFERVEQSRQQAN